MQLLHSAAKFTSYIKDLRSIYLTFIRSVLEQSSVVWHSSLSVKNRKDLERVQKSAVRVILGPRYSNYKQGLKMVNLETLAQRREKLSLKFAQKCLKNPKVKDFFPLTDSKNKMRKRNPKKFKNLE